MAKKTIDLKRLKTIRNSFLKINIKYNSLKIWGDYMKKIKKGDIVARKSYGMDIIFYVKRIIKLKEKK